MGALFGATVLALALACGGASANGGKPAEPQQLTPDEQAAKDLLERYAKEMKVQQEQNLFRAEQHFKVGKAHFDHGAWKEALAQFESVLALDPTHKGAQEYLGKTRGLLGIREGPLDLIVPYKSQWSVALKMHKLELMNTFARATALYDKGEYAEAIRLFELAGAKARYLAPYLDLAKTVEEAEVLRRKAEAALEAQRGQAEKTRLDRSKEEAEKLQKQSQGLFRERQQARLVQARDLFGQHRYEQARKLCDEILGHDPANGAAETLRAQAAEAIRAETVERVITSRRAETDRYMDGIAALSLPQSEVVHMPRGRFEEVRNRKVRAIFGGAEKPPEAWEARVRESLERKVSFDFVETPLQDVVTFLSSLAGVSVIVDTEAIKGTRHDVTLRVQDMRLGSALNWICKLVGLKYGLKHEAIFISEPKRLYDETVLRMFDVTDLTMEIKNFKGRAQALSSGDGYSANEGGSDGAGSFFDPPEEEEDKGLSGDKLIEFIKQIIAPGKWDPEEGGEPFGLRDDSKEGKGQALADLIGITVGGRTFLAVKTKE